MMHYNSRFKKHIASMVIFFIFILIAAGSSDSRTAGDRLADKYNVSVKKAEQCLAEWNSYGERNYETLLEYIGSKGIFGFFQPSCDGSIKEKFKNYKTAYLSAPIYGETSQECEDWKPDGLFDNFRKNCLLEDFLFLHRERGLTLKEISIKNASANIPYNSKVAQEKQGARERLAKRCSAVRHPCDKGNGSLERLCMMPPHYWSDTGYFDCPVELRRRY